MPPKKQKAVKPEPEPEPVPEPEPAKEEVNEQKRHKKVYQPKSFTVFIREKSTFYLALYCKKNPYVIYKGLGVLFVKQYYKKIYQMYHNTVADFYELCSHFKENNFTIDITNTNCNILVIKQVKGVKIYNVCNQLVENLVDFSFDCNGLTYLVFGAAEYLAQAREMLIRMKNKIVAECRVREKQTSFKLKPVIQVVEELQPEYGQDQVIVSPKVEYQIIHSPNSESKAATGDAQSLDQK